MTVSEALAATLVDRYAFERELGRGGMATVYVAEDRKHHRRVAIKVLRPELGTTLGAERFLREIEVVARLNHPHILALIDSGQAGDLLYFVMPFVEGESLRQRLERERQLPFNEAIAIAKHVAAALEFAHRHGVIHRDIKPANILLHEGEAVVADFGIALAAQSAGEDRLTAAGLSLGTPEYMSPEQATGERTADARSDVYGLACLLYEMLAGEPPYVGLTTRAILAKAITDPVPSIRRLRPGVSDAVDAAVTRGLAKDPADRFSSAAEFAQALAEPAPPPSNRQSVAVLPFANLSPDPENAFFTDGVTDDLIAQVAKISGLKVISRTSVLRYKNTELPIRQIGAELGVAAVVEGTVRRAGNRVRVVAQLIDTTSDAHLWSETYDRTLDDVFSVQSEVALSIAGALEATLTADERWRLTRKPTANGAAYDLYLLGRHHYNKRTDESLRKAIGFFEQAIARDPEYAAAHAGLADAYSLAAIGYASIAQADAFAKAKDAASRALALDRASPDALCAQGLATLMHDWEIPAARRSFERAAALNPNHVAAYQWLAWCLFVAGDYLGAVEVQERALQLDPLSVALIAESGWPYSYAGLHETALRRYRHALEIDPSFALAHYNAGLSYRGLGLFADAIGAFERALAIIGRPPWLLADLAMTQIDVGDRAKAEQLLAELHEQSSAGMAASLPIALVSDALDDTDGALAALEKAYADRESFMCGLGLERLYTFKHARATPRFQQLMERLGLKHHDIANQRALLSAHRPIREEQTYYGR